MRRRFPVVCSTAKIRCRLRIPKADHRVPRIRRASPRRFHKKCFCRPSFANTARRTISRLREISLSARSAFFARFQIIFGKGIDKVPKTWYHIRAFKICGCSSVVEHQPSKLVMWVRFPSPAPLFEERTRCSAASHTQKNVRHFLSGMPEFLPTRDFMYL